MSVITTSGHSVQSGHKLNLFGSILRSSYSLFLAIIRMAGATGLTYHAELHGDVFDVAGCGHRHHLALSCSSWVALA